MVDKPAVTDLSHHFLMWGQKTRFMKNTAFDLSPRQRVKMPCQTSPAPTVSTVLTENAGMFASKFFSHLSLSITMGFALKI